MDSAVDVDVAASAQQNKVVGVCFELWVGGDGLHVVYVESRAFDSAARAGVVVALAGEEGELSPLVGSVKAWGHGG